MRCLGFKLTDDSVGVYFDDETEIVALRDGVSFFYYEKSKVNVLGNQEILSKYTLESFPKALSEKVNLMI